MRIALSASTVVAVWGLLYFRVGPVPTWFYVFAWYPTLILLDAIASRPEGRPSLFADRRLAVSLFAWSPVIWLVFEAANLRLHNWYYVSLPALQWERWSGILLSFATVVPALLLAERVFDSAGACKRWRTRPIAIRPWELRTAVGLGLGIGALALLRPVVFFPLIWGSVFLIADPFVYRRIPQLSLIRDVERGEWGRIGRLMLGGIGIGLIWETYNYWADGHWIYTVPWLEQTKLFEMPPLGFVGFPFLALEAWSMYAALCALGVAIPVSGMARVAPKRLAVAGTAALAFVVVTLSTMERYTISSTVPRLAELPGITPRQVEIMRGAEIRSLNHLARIDWRRLVAATELDSTTATRMVETARLVTLRGIGNKHARKLLQLGVDDVCILATRDGAQLAHALRDELSPVRPTTAETRVWVRSAKRACGQEGPT